MQWAVGEIREVMLGWLGPILGGSAALILWGMDQTVLMTLSILSGIGCFWSGGIMHNFATEVAKHRPNYTGGFYDITPGEADSVPNWIAGLNVLCTVAVLILLATAIIIRIF